MNRRTISALAILVIFLSAGSTVALAQDPSDTSDFEIETVNGEPANQTNDVRFFRNDPIVIELDGLDVSEHQFNVTIANRTYSLLPEDNGEIRPRGDPPAPGEYTMTVTQTYRDKEYESAQTRINITDTKSTDDQERPEPTPFEIETVNGEPANETNDVRFFRNDPIIIELDGLNVSEHQFNVTIDNRTYPLLPDDNGEIRPRDNPPAPGEYTMTVTQTYRDEEFESAQTQINITATKATESDEQPEPTAFEIETVNGEPANETNDVRFFRNEPIVIELDGLNVSEHQFNVTIANRTYSLLPEDDGEIRPRDNPPAPGEYTMTVTQTFRDEEFESAQTQINITATKATEDEVRPEPTAFEIKTVNGESADRLNDVPFFRDDPIVVELDGLNVSEHRFNVTIGDRTYPLLPDDNGEIRPRGDPPEPGEYTMTVTQTFRDEEFESAQTQINITDTKTTAGDERPEPTPFGIETINGISATETNEVRFSREEPIVIELEGVNVSEHRFNVTIGDRTYPLLPDDNGEIRPRRDPPAPGEYTMTVTQIYRGEQVESTQTQITIVESDDSRSDRNESTAATTNGERDRDNGTTDMPAESGPGFGILGTFLSLLGVTVLFWLTATSRFSLGGSR